MAKLALWTACARLAHADDEGMTQIAKYLNARIAVGTGGTYTGGKGVLVRTPDFFQGDTKSVPGTFWVNDILTPSGLYPSKNPLCPTSGDGVSSLQEDCSAGSSWDDATVAVVIGSQMKNLFTDWDGIQDSDWGWGVFYPFDSNSCDGRCAWLEEYNGWDCPGGWVDGNTVQFVPDGHKGAGDYYPGNPFANDHMGAGSWGGGGAGCHFDSGAFDQMDADDELNLVQDAACQCTMVFNDNWEHWVQHLLAKGIQKEGFEWRGWFSNGGKAPTWAMDSSVCWVSNFRDMIGIQNALFKVAYDWNNQLMPASDWTGGSQQERIYWGWNEIPVSTQDVDDPHNWDSIIIKLPADLCQYKDGEFDTPDCLSDSSQDDLLSQLKMFENSGKLLMGQSAVTGKPSSNVLFVREYRVDGGWNRFFFCHNWARSDRQVKYHGVPFAKCYYDVKTSSIDVV